MTLSIRCEGIDRTIKKLRAYRNSLREKQRPFMERLAEIGIETATMRFTEAVYDGTNDVTVRPDPEWTDDNRLAVVASGSTILFIEFGTGVHYAEQHPQAAEFGYTRGGYGHHLGRFDSWRYSGDPGTNGEVITEGPHKGMVRTHGNPPARAMYDASKEMRQRILEIAKEIYND